MALDIRLVDREEALKRAASRRTKWNLVLEQVKNAPEGKVVEVVLWPDGDLPRNHRARMYNAVALLRQRARKLGLQVNVYKADDGRRIFVERAS